MKKFHLKASVIVSFYNDLSSLELIISALENQTTKDFELVIADDGSKPEVVLALESVISNSTLSVKHVWHEDNGFRKTKILNQALLKCEAAYIIFIDGDCIPEKHFVADHLRLSGESKVLTGRRVNLSQRISLQLSPNKIKAGFLQGSFILRLAFDGLRAGTKDVEKGIWQGSNLINYYFAKKNKGVLGCNFSVSKASLIAINGFDERYKHPGVGEDSEIEYRLKKLGLTVNSPKFCMVMYHLHHKRQSRQFEEENLKLYKETMDKQYVSTPYGLIK